MQDLVREKEEEEEERRRRREGNVSNVSTFFLTRREKKIP
jgi:hypothetical protein